MANDSSTSTTGEMLAYLQQLRARVASLEQPMDAGNAISDSDDEDEEVMKHYQGGHYTYPLQVTERPVDYTNGDTYQGSMLGEQRHGTGSHTTSTGDVYTGGWHYDKRHGQGTFKAASGLVYEGSWRDDKTNGSGRCTYPDGSVYKGDWLDDERSGWGTLTTADGQTYEGEWEANAPHGQGVWTFADGLSHFKGSYKAGQRVEGQLVMFDAHSKKPAHTYTGRFQNDLRHCPDGVGVEEGLWMYRGSWQQDSRSGSGHCRYTDGSEYEGQWLNDMRHGSGRLTLSDGTTYDGQWREDKLHGAAKAKYASGEVYMGHWQHGQRHGQGKWTSAPKAAPTGRPAPAADPGTQAAPAASQHAGPGGGSSSSSASSAKAAKEVRETYVGGWVGGKREGHGVAEYADGGRYEGQWKAGVRHGQGLMLFADGTVFRGAWEVDEWLQSAAEPALCRTSGPGLSRAVAGQRAEFVIEARDELSNPRLNGGDTFQVLLLPVAPLAVHAPALTTAAAAPLTLPWPTTLSSSSGARLIRAGADDDSSSSSSSGASVGYEGYLSPRPAAAPATAAAVVEAVAVGDVQDSGDGRYSCSYVHPVAGVYELHVTNGEGEHVAGSPCRVHILPGAPSPRHSTVCGPGRSAAVAGARADFTVTFRDAFGNACWSSAGAAESATGCDAVRAGDRAAVCSSGGTSSLPAELEPLEARLVGSNTITAAGVNVAQLPGGGGAWSCSYTAPTAPGLYVLEVTAGGRHVGGSPFSVKVAPAATAPATLSAAAIARAGAGSTPHNSATAAFDSGAPLTPAADSAGDGGASINTPPAGVQDKLRWWGEVAMQAYEAIDGSLQGFEEGAAAGDAAPGAAAGAWVGMSAQEAEMVKANPSLAVVERLEDLWLLSRLQQERKTKQQQQQQQQAGKPAVQLHAQRSSAQQAGAPTTPIAQQQEGSGSLEQRHTPAMPDNSHAEHSMGCSSFASSTLDPHRVAPAEADGAMTSSAENTVGVAAGPLLHGVAAPVSAGGAASPSWLYELD